MSFEVKDKVLYKSSGRSWLTNRQGDILALNSSKASALVRFPDNGIYRETEEWIGVNSLEKVASPVSEVVIKLNERKKQLEDEITQIDKAISLLNGIA